MTALAPAAPAAPAAASARFVESLVTASRLGEQGAPMLDVALALVGGEWPVFPCAQDKSPLVGGGFKARERDAEKVRQWWTAHPNAMPAICPGDGGLAAFDVDSTEAATAVCEAGVSLSEGLVVETGGTSQPFEQDGQQRRPMHVYVLATEQPKVPGVVVRFRSGYVIAPGARRGERVYRVAACDEPAAWAGDAKTTPIVQTPPVSSAQRPDIARVREAVARIPNTENTDRDRYVAVAHMIKSAAGDEGRDIFLDWAAQYPGVVDPAEDARVFDSITKPKTGWTQLWHTAASHGFDARPERQAEAQNDFADVPVPESSANAPPPKTLGGTQSTALLRLASPAELFHTGNHDAYALVPVEEHVECWPLRSDGFVRWLKREFYHEQHTAPKAQAVIDALGILESIAQFDSPMQEVFVRVARIADTVYIDLANTSWQAIKVTPAGWEIVDRPPVAFCRPAGMLELPIPARGGGLDDLWPFVNIVEQDRPLVAAALVSWLAGRGPYIVACLIGAQGSAKSVTSRVFRSLVDPSEVPLRAMPRDERDLAVAAANNWLLALDNASYLPGWLSDAMCRIASGAGFATRGLYTDKKEIQFKAERPQLINGIEDPVDRDDLRDRAVFLFAPLLDDHARLDEASLWQAFDEKRGRILGALLDLLSTALKNLPGTRVAVTPRMADFVRVGVAAGIEGFYEAYLDNRSQAIERGISGDPLATQIKLLATGRTEPWEGTATELLAQLNEQMSWSDLPKWWPRTARALSGKLRRMVPSLQHTGVVVELDRPLGRGTDKRRGIRVEHLQRKAA